MRNRHNIPARLAVGALLAALWVAPAPAGVDRFAGTAVETDQTTTATARTAKSDALVVAQRRKPANRPTGRPVERKP